MALQQRMLPWALHTPENLQRWATDAKLVIESHKTILCPVAKAANSSIKVAYIHGQQQTPVPDDIECVLGYVKQWKLAEYNWILTAHQLWTLLDAGYHTIGFVRHPLSRLVSCWADKFERASGVGRRLSTHYGWSESPGFSEFVRDVACIPHHEANNHFRPQYMFLEGLADEIVHVEDFGTEWPKLQQRYPLADIPVTHTSKQRDWRGMYDEETMLLTEEYYRRDLEFYGYSSG